MNPEAEAAVTERFQQSKARLRNELQDQLQSRMEQLDEEHSTLEYVRNKAEISALEAKVNKAVIVFSSLRLSIKQKSDKCSFRDVLRDHVFKFWACKTCSGV